MAHYRKTRLSLQDLAKRVIVEYGMLASELAGLKTMSAQRIQAFKAVCIAENC